MTTSARLVDATSVQLSPSHLDPEQIVDGSPRTAFTAFAEIGGTEIGIWEHSPGTSRDVETAEAFVVLTGRATVTFESGEAIELQPGQLVRLHAGERTVWAVQETLRKVYVAG